MEINSYENCVISWRMLSNSDKLFKLREHFLLRYIQGTENIEGLNLSYRQTKELFEHETVSNYSGDLRSLFSVLNARNTFDFIADNLRKETEITPSFILRLHLIVMRNSLDMHRYMDNCERAGEFKKKHYVVGKSGQGSLPSNVPSDIQKLCAFVVENANKDPLKVATAMHCYFEVIHPFADGNGRVGRWLLNYYLLLRGHPPIVIPIESRQAYYDALDAFDDEEDYEKLYELLKNDCVATWSNSIGGLTLNKLKL